MSNLIVNAVANHNATPQPVSPKVENTDNEKQPRISNTGKVIGGLSAFAILGTGIYFAVRRGKVFTGNKFKTIVKEDGSLERLFPNGNKVNIKIYPEKDGGWSRSIIVTDSNGKKIADRSKSFYKYNDHTSLHTDTRKGFNADGVPTTYTLKSIDRYQDRVKFSNSEYYYNENGISDENLIKSIMGNRTTDKQGKLISEDTSTQIRNKFGAFDEESNSIKYNEDGTITTSNDSNKYMEENLRNQKHNAKTVDINGNVLNIYEQDTHTDKKLNMLKDIYHIESYKIDKNGKPILDSFNLIKTATPKKNDYTLLDQKVLEKTEEGKKYFRFKKFERDENGIGKLVEHRENLDGTVIENSHKQKSGPDVDYNTLLERNENEF